MLYARCAFLYSCMLVMRIEPRASQIPNPLCTNGQHFQPWCVWACLQRSDLWNWFSSFHYVGSRIELRWSGFWGKPWDMSHLNSPVSFYFFHAWNQNQSLTLLCMFFCSLAFSFFHSFLVFFLFSLLCKFPCLVCRGFLFYFLNLCDHITLLCGSFGSYSTSLLYVAFKLLTVFFN